MFGNGIVSSHLSEHIISVHVVTDDAAQMKGDAMRLDVSGETPTHLNVGALIVLAPQATDRKEKIAIKKSSRGRSSLVQKKSSGRSGKL